MLSWAVPARVSGPSCISPAPYWKASHPLPRWCAPGGGQARPRLPVLSSRQQQLVQLFSSAAPGGPCPMHSPTICPWLLGYAPLHTTWLPLPGVPWQGCRTPAAQVLHLSVDAGRTLITPAQVRSLRLEHLRALGRAYLACAQPLIGPAREDHDGPAAARLQVGPSGLDAVHGQIAAGQAAMPGACRCRSDQPQELPCLPHGLLLACHSHLQPDSPRCACLRRSTHPSPRCPDSATDLLVWAAAAAAPGHDRGGRSGVPAQRAGAAPVHAEQRRGHPEQCGCGRAPGARALHALHAPCLAAQGPPPPPSWDSVPGRCCTCGAHPMCCLRVACACLLVTQTACTIAHVWCNA